MYARSVGAGVPEDGAESTVAEPHWFGPADRPLFGWLHYPASGEIRAGVVLCPSLGLEAGFSHHVLRQVAEDLAGRGFLSLRFDYDGTGDSAGAGDDPDRVGAWQRSISAGLDLVASIGGGPVAMVGMRIGALLAVEEARRRVCVDALVLWDPPPSGRRYLRELRVRHSVSLGEEPQTVPVFDVMGTSFSGETVADLHRLKLPDLGCLPATRSLVLERPARPASQSAALTDSVTVLSAADQDALLLGQKTPAASIGEVVNWLSTTFPDPRTGQANLADLPDGDEPHRLPTADGEVVERFVSLGPNRLFGILTEPEHPVTGPTVVFVPDAYTPHVGLSRMWVDLARAWAARGLRVLRFDLSGNGDSNPRPGEPPHRAALVEFMDDVQDAIQAVAPANPRDVVLVGICSGAYLCLEAAHTVPPRGMLIMNPAFSILTAEWPPSRRRRARQAARRALWIPFGHLIGRAARKFSPVLRDDPEFNWDQWFEACYWQLSIRRRVPNIPEAVWRIANKVLLGQHSVDVLGRIADSGVDVLIGVGDPDINNVTFGARRKLKRLQARPGFRMEYLPGLDHSVLKSGQRERVMSVLTDHLVSRFAPVDRPGQQVEVAQSARSA